MNKEVIFHVSIPSDELEINITNHFPNIITNVCEDKGYELEEEVEIEETKITVDWGDASVEEIYKTGDEIKHKYLIKGDYQILIRIHKDNNDDFILFDSSASEYVDLKKYTTNVVIRKNNTSPFKAVSRPFQSFTLLNSVSHRIFENCKEQKSFNRAFFGCSSLNRISKHLFKWSPNVVDFSQVFRKCVGVNNVPIEIFKYNKKARNFKYSFYSCGNADSEMITDGLFNYLELADEDRINVFLTFSGDFVGGDNYTHGQTGVKVDQNLFVDITEHLDSRFGQTEDYSQMRPFTTNANVKHIKFGDTLKMSNMQWLVDNGGCQTPTELLTVKLPKTILNFDGTVPSSINIGWGLRNNENLHTVYWFDIPEKTTYIELVDAMISCKSLRRIYNFNCSTYKYDSPNNTHPIWNYFNGDNGLFIDTTLDEETLNYIVTTMGSWVGYTGTDNRNVIVVGCCTEAYNSANTLFTEDGDTVTASTHSGRNCKVCYDASKNFTYKILDNETYWNNQASAPTTLELIEEEINGPSNPEE